MVPGGRSSRKRRTERRKKVEGAVEDLSRVLEEGLDNHSDIADIASKHLLSIGKKYGSRPNSRISRHICRTCRKALIPGKSSRVRIVSKTVTTTCLRCGRVIRERPNSSGGVD